MGTPTPVLSLIRRLSKQTPVIVMTAHGNDGPHQGVDCIRMGAADYIPKPFPIRGRTLDRAILEALERSGQSGHKVALTRKPSGPPRAFDGGSLVLFKRQVEACGIDIPIGPGMHQILSRLAEMRSNGKYVAYAGSDLTELLDTDCGQNGIANQILGFRNKVAQRLLEVANITCERTSIIASGGPGYRLQEWMTVESGHRTVARINSATEEPDGASPIDPSSASTTSESQPLIDLNERQRWALAELKQGTKLQVRHLMGRFGCSSATAKRDLTALKSAGYVRFAGSARAGHYMRATE